MIEGRVETLDQITEAVRKYTLLPWSRRVSADGVLVLTTTTTTVVTHFHIKHNVHFALLQAFSPLRVAAIYSELGVDVRCSTFGGDDKDWVHVRVEVGHEQ